MGRYNDVRALVLGLETNGLSVVRSLGRARVLVAGVDSELDQVTSLSKYLLSRIKTTDIRGPGLIDTLIEIAQDSCRYALFPTVESTVFHISEGRDRLPENIIVRLPDKETVRALLHKGSFRKLCDELNLPSPASAVAVDTGELDAALGKLRLPVVMKSVVKETGPGPKAVVVEGVDEAVCAYRDQGEGEVILEEWIPGTDNDVYFCLQGYDSYSNLLASFTGRKIRQWPPLVGGTASAEPADLPELEETTTGFFRAVGYKGLCSMEYKYDSRDSRFYAIEPTVGRTDYQSGIAPANNVNIALAVFTDMAGTAFKPGKNRGYVKWVDKVGDYRSAMHYIKSGELTRAGWRKSLSGPKVSTLFAIDDPGPWASDFFRRGMGRVNRFFKKGENTT